MEKDFPLYHTTTLKKNLTHPTWVISNSWFSTEYLAKFLGDEIQENNLTSEDLEVKLEVARLISDMER